MPRDSIGEYLISSRSFAEYTAMFALTEDDLCGRVLDCPGGGAGFAATAGAQGTDATAVDPVYASAPEEIDARLTRELERGAAWLQARVQQYVWNFHESPESCARLRRESAGVFAADYRAHRERYVSASLPTLPFGDSSFDLVLSSHLLFTYGDRLGRGFHLAALTEMARVSRGQVRVYPLVDQAGEARTDLVAALRADLAAGGVRTSVCEVAYEFQRGARHMLVLHARGFGDVDVAVRR